MDVIGIGIDLVSVKRIEILWKHYKKRFELKLFTLQELSYAFKKACPFQTLAGFFAAKEAYYKAVGGYSGFSFREIEVLKQNGAPVLHLTGKALQAFKKKQAKGVLVSISHEKEYAVAVVILKA